ncbi:MAG TPA: hypothetical protein VF727_05915 [Allosphingosinicella sp.]|jgi:hypothetical protein
MSERILRRKRRYRVSGENDRGDMFSYHTDDRECAAYMERIMAEVLHKVDVVESRTD